MPSPQTPAAPAAAAAPPPLVIIEPPERCATGGAGPRWPDLIGWREGRVLSTEWLAAGGPLDAPDALPMGGCWSYEYTGLNTRIHYGSVLREGARS